MRIIGTSSRTKAITFSHRRLHLAPAYQWTFSKTYAFATQLTAPPGQGVIPVPAAGVAPPGDLRLTPIATLARGGPPPRVSADGDVRIRN
jgi:hypothetical protein